MKITYSREADALLVELDGQTPVAQTTQFPVEDCPKCGSAGWKMTNPPICAGCGFRAPLVSIDLDAAGRVLAIEILNARASYPGADLEQLGSAAEPLILAQAGKESGLSPETLKKQIAAGRLVAHKQGRDWIVYRHDLLNYLESRDPKGRPATKRKGRRPARQKVTR